MKSDLRLAVITIAVAVIGALAILIGMPSTSFTAPGGKPIVIGYVGNVASPGTKPCMDIQQMAVDEINAAGGIMGRPVKYIVMDGKGDTSLSIEAARKLIIEDKASFISVEGRTEICLAVQENSGRLFKEYPHILVFNGPMGSELTARIIDEPGKYDFCFRDWDPEPAHYAQMKYYFCTTWPRDFKVKKVAILWEDLAWTRKHITALLDDIEDKHGLRQSDVALTILSSICGWYAKRDEEYASPIIRGMKRYSNKEHARERVLTDSELRTLWLADGLFGNFTKLALLTGQRREKLLTMRYDDVRNGVWHISTEAREKGNGEELKLPTLALEILANQKTVCPGPLVFDCPITSLRNMRLRFNHRHKMREWSIHDLRRTARTLMAAAGVPDVVAELVLGHVQRGVQAIYNRHAYFEEKAEALEKLAARLTDIVYERKAA